MTHHDHDINDVAAHNHIRKAQLLLEAIDANATKLDPRDPLNVAMMQVSATVALTHAQIATRLERHRGR